MFTTMEDLIKQTVAFSGYRSDKISLLSSDPEFISNLNEKIMRCIFDLHYRGFRYFITGGAQGFDLIVAKCLLEFRAHYYSDIKIIAAIPHEEQSRNYTQSDILQYERVLCTADQIHYISKKHYKGVYLDRNKYMLIRSSVLVCYYDGKRGGTMYTVNRALRMGHEIINLCEGYEIKRSDTQMSLL